MLMLQAMEEQTRSNRQGEGQENGGIRDRVIHKDEILHRRETHLDNDSFKLHEAKQNVVTDQLFIGSYYVGSVREDPGFTSSSHPRHETEASWRVRM